MAFNSSAKDSTVSATPTGRIAPDYPGSKVIRRTDLGMNGHPAAHPSKNPQACLVALPDELRVCIAKYLQRKDLFSLGMVNRNLSCIAMPLIYAMGIDPSMSHKARVAFTSRIDEDDTLAEMVKKIHFRYAFTRPMKYQRVQGRAPRTLVLNEQLAAIHDRATERELESLVTLFLSAVNVEELCIDDFSGRAVDMHRESLPYWVHLVCMAGTLIQPEDQPFRHLRVLNIRFSPVSAGWIRLDNFVPILKLPRIEELHLQGFIETQFPYNWDCELKSSNLKKLVLRNTFLHWKVVSLLVESCKALEIFHYMYEAMMSVPPLPGSHPRNGWAPHSWAGIGDALRTQEHSLKTLTIAYVVNRVQLGVAARLYPVYAWQIGTLGSFAAFDKLKHIRVPADAMVLAPGITQCLPIGLEVLSLRYDETTEVAETRCMESIVAVIAGNKQAGRKLRHLHLSLSDDVPFQQYSVTGCREAAVKFLISRSSVLWNLGRTVYRAG
ncbi:hypothetical protein P171DRAFT_523107 [Karstenula rhodostoma CBS 690.94]|uniref:F-box domain-containing protein n=1 Tax=Karstenula rhodostoma CBS 690.94 TaxID=1392251 RepID=A0A9P4PE83_9PLEO|nr:hypothetical protein P171DRAFT_523107 [Karstenula rhodostoma CBS 690.94]